MAKLPCSILLILLTFTSSYGQSKKDKKLENALDALIAKRLTSIAPGCVILVAKKGDIIYKKAFGMADIASNKPMRPDMVFRIGSITKQFTAVAILQLVQEKKISLQDSIQKYIKDYPHKGYKITIEHLLTHTSGIKEYMAITNRSAERLTYTPKQGVDYFKDEPSEFLPGSRYKYSNSNYYLLGYIIELVSGASYAGYLQQNILNKLELSNTFYIDPDKRISNMPQGYSRFDGKIEKAELEEITTIYSAGGLLSNADDLFKWHVSLYDGKLLRRETLDRAFIPYKFSDGSSSQYGYGWFVRNVSDSKTLEHPGSTDGFQTDMIYFPDEDVFIITLFNCYEQDMDWTVLSNDIGRLVLGKPLTGNVSLNENLLKSYAGEYVLNDENKLIVTFENGNFFIKATNPKARLPKVQLYAESENMFYMKEAPLKFEFLKGENITKIIVYNNRGKDGEFIKAK